MDIQPDSQTTQTISDDQELAKVLAGVGQDDNKSDGEQDEAMLPTPPTPMPTNDDATAASAEEPATAPVDEPVAATPDFSVPPAPSAAVADASSLDSIKQAALGELRPLVDKLNVSPEEKFDTYLLLLRSTDDKELIAPAHEAAKNIVDEAKRAQALLDIIKEIDFLSQSQTQA